MLQDKDIMIRFNVRVRELDRQYEKFNNQDFDNGVYHKYAYNQGKKKEGEDDLKEEVIEKDEVSNQNLVRDNKKRKKQEELNYLNYYLKIDERIVGLVEQYGFPKPFVMKCL